tara:strand:+ start:2774 stop:4114 length:1341 start_codon:yes stop_codon:yes gene_type:complete
MTILSRQSTPATINEATVISNTSGETVGLENGTFNLTYYESILQDTIHASFTYSDTGTINGPFDGKNAVDGLPIKGSEKFLLKFTDNLDNVLEFKGDSSLYVNNVTSLLDETTKSMTQLHLVSKEYILNEKVRINSRLDGLVSQHIEKILTEEKYLNTKKDIDIEETVLQINETPKNKKPFYIMNEMSKKGVSAENQKLGKSAGYFLYETSEGFKFKSIDGMLSQEPKLRVLYNETTSQSEKEMPSGYDVKALTYERYNLVNVQKKLAIGAFTSKVLTFNPFSFSFEIANPQSFLFENDYKMGGEELFKLNEEFSSSEANGDFSITSLKMKSVGGLQIGNTETQLSKSKEVDFTVDQILNQSFMRYNQLFTSQVSITIPGDFSLHAGDAIVVDAPIVESDTKNDDLNEQSGGLYIISDLAHYVTPHETFTKLNLIRDSFGTKPKND